MRIPPLFVCVMAVAALSMSLVGCGSGSTDTPVNQIDGTPPPLDAEIDGGGHEGHDHGDEASHGHPTEGPHGGHLIELGNEEYHAELLHDEDSHRVTIHLLDSAGKEPVPAPLREITLQLLRDGQFVQYALKAVSPSGSVDGTVSQFEIIDDALCDALCHQDELRGRLQVTLNGKPYTGTIEHSSHDAHDGHDDDHTEEDHVNH